jgi:hypothetical protein
MNGADNRDSDYLRSEESKLSDIPKLQILRFCSCGRRRMLRMTWRYLFIVLILISSSPIKN